MTSTDGRRRLPPWALLWPASLGVALLLAACGVGPRGVPEESLALGQAIYEANCAVCHGPNGEGQPNWHIRKADGTLSPPPLNGDGHTWHHGDGTLYVYVSQGGAAFDSPSLPDYRSGMPAFGDSLSHEEIVSVINYIKNLWGGKEFRGAVKRESQAEVSTRDQFPETAP